MEQLEGFAEFLKNYGSHAISTIILALYWLERRERIDTQNKLEQTLVAMADKAAASAEKLAQASVAMERIMLRAGVEIEDHEHS